MACNGSFHISTIRKKQGVAITGLALVGFVLAHLSGNLLIFKGPEALNEYAKFLASLGPVLWGMRIGLLAAFVAHIVLIAGLVIDNKRARPKNYEVKADHYKGANQLGVKSMRYTGALILFYIFFHLADFTFAAHHGPTTMIDGVELGLYGLVVNTLKNPVHAGFYILIMISLGLHLSHSLQSVFQTFGWQSKSSRGWMSQVSAIIGLAIALGYSSIPIYILTCL